MYRPYGEIIDVYTALKAHFIDAYTALMIESALVGGVLYGNELL